MAKKDVIRFETWKGKKVLVVRNSKGNILARKNLKGSGITTKQQAYNLYKRTNTFDKTAVRISKSNPEIENENINKIQFKGRDGQKNISVKGKGFRHTQQIGKNTAIVHTKEPLKNQDYYQYKVTVEWGNKKETTEGFSDMRGTQQQAFTRARAGAVQRNIIKYDDDIQFISETEGIATSQSGRKKTYFKVMSEVQTYVNTIKSFV